MDFTRATDVTPEVEAAVEDAFEYHPWSEEQIEKGKKVRRALIDAVLVILRNVPPGPDRTVAIRKIREARIGREQRHHARRKILAGFLVNAGRAG